MRKSFAIVLLIPLVFTSVFSHERIIDARGTRLDVDVYGRIFILDRESAVVRCFRREGTLIATTGGQGWERDQMDSPSGLWAGNGIDVFVADYGNHRILRFDRKLAFVSSFSARDQSDPSLRFGYPLSVAVSRQGTLFVLDSEEKRIIKISRSSIVEGTFGGFDAGRGRLRDPRMLRVGPEDRVYVLDGNRVLVFDPFGNFVRNVTTESTDPINILAADGSGVGLIANGKLYCFDVNDRNCGAASLDFPPGTVFLDAVFRADSLFVLTDSGVYALEDPRIHGNDTLDKVKKSR